MPAAQSLRSEGQKDGEFRALSIIDLPEHQGRPKSAVSDSRKCCNNYVLTCNYSHLQMTAVDYKAEQPSHQTAQPIPQQLTQPYVNYDAPYSSYLTLGGKRQVCCPRRP